MHRSLESKVAIVTGAGRGIGRAVALKLASAGAAVVVNDLDEAPANEVVAEIEGTGARAMACAGNVAAPDFGTRVVAATLERFGAIDIIINNAGYTWDNVIQKMSDEQFEAMLACHLSAPFRLLRAAQPYLRSASSAEQAQGREIFRKVVNVSSVSGTGGNAGQVNYSAAKAGVIGLTKAMAKEWGRMKVNVNCVAFGAIETRLTQRVPQGERALVNIDGNEVRVGIPAERATLAEREIPLGRLGTPEEAAGAIYLFCLPESDYISGQTLICGGGRGGF
ncbi:SDR family NAD(P)-dependent oxidoreductase [Xenophilus arseniciresistens]|uniref:SDR family NAD(P)-dependent oxidoreductase n=1 Tax=Xenophilus arseniciresistens TaxID=1283306 RepID=A0AAE3N4Z8_9BURK|nr:SDR family NAD(P)-dependent oxidoreductase [Xenophilus arseniciresistens]MDA7415321.1 SDR family NAD(P)-dependent oxidoreductase [Xenophilus arseniciresistens]